MKSFYYDIFLSGLTYVLLTYLAFRLMKKRKSKGSDDDGGDLISNTPKIDLPPGVVWPNDPKATKSDKEAEVLC